MLTSSLEIGIEIMKNIRIIIALVLALSAMLLVTSCDKGEESADMSASANTEASQEAEPAEEPAPEVAQIAMTIDNIDAEGDKKHKPLQIKSIVLYDDGTVEIVPLDELKENELGSSEEKGIFPFGDFGKVKEVYVVGYGDEGYRTIIALMEDGTISAINGKALVEDHIITVAPKISGREDYVSVEIVEGDNGSSIIGHTKEDGEVILDNSVNFQ